MSNDNKIIKTILEFAMDKDVLEKRIDSQETNILDHVIKIMVLVNSGNQERWAGEISNKFCKPITKKLKMNNKFPEASVYMHYLYDPSLETYEEYVNYVNNCLRIWEEESNTFYSFYKKDIKTEEDYKKITNFYIKICDLMSKGIVPSPEQILDSLKS